MFEKEIYKKGKKFYGWWLKDATTGTVIYMARKWHRDMFRNGELSLSEAMRKGVAGWGFDRETIELVKIRGASFIGVHVVETGTRYLASVDDLSNVYQRSFHLADNSTLHRRYLPLKYFRVLHKLKL